MREHFRTAWTYIRRSPYQALAAILIMVLTFFVATIFILTAGGFQIVLRYFETRPQVTAFFEDKMTPQEVDVLRAKLAQTDKVKESKYISKEQALAIYREQNKNDPLLLEMVTANILPASLEVSATDISYLPEIAQILHQEPGVEEVIFQEDVVRALSNWTGTLRKIGIGLIGTLALVSLLIILIIVGVKITLRREEIEILQLIGASPWYIRAPFVFEGIFYGIVGAIVGWGGAYLLFLYLTPFIVKFLSGISLLPVSVLFMLEVLGFEILLGMVIGFFGSLMAVKRYLK